MDEELQQIEKAYDLITEFLVTYSFQVVGAIVILVVGFFVSRSISRVIDKFCRSRGIDVTLSKFLSNAIHILIFGCFIIISLGKFGISIAPFVAALGALTFGVGLALQGPVSNYGAGLAIILSRPFKVGDTVTITEYSGVVKEVKLANTQLATEDGEIITIPNKKIIGEVIHNSFSYKLAEVVVGIDYADEPQTAIDAIVAVLSAAEGVADEPKPQVGIEGFGDFSVNIGVRFWVPMESYFETKYRVNQGIYDAVKRAGITIPFPRRDIKMLDQ
ncbi:mechanosensitive ion channel family protein [Litoribrevibacter albus]|uniref:Small-conductance mechanosensitive channel n=1 Tax=Litoribrevibacter albus TaxID=1473156 RepID=A0AA37W7D3_9GAMM|nr:mechanosensitive ion channel family protein [Litoribrevibacter albus]GLQ30311.1 mechanosensitive ion channel protein [Litoribrevibacter albus]